MLELIGHAVTPLNIILVIVVVIGYFVVRAMMGKRW